MKSNRLYKFDWTDLLSRIPFHPILVAVAPVLFLLSNNSTQIRMGAAFRAIIISVAAGLFTVIAIQVILGNWERSALVSSFISLMFFTYGHFYDVMRFAGDVGWAVVRHRYLAPVWLLILVAGAISLGRMRYRNGPPTMALNLISFAVVVVSIGQIVSYELTSSSAARTIRRSATVPTALSVPDGELPPDIYYIILDAYNRDDYLLQFYEFDNQPFLDALEDIGFYIGRCSRSNYSQTYLSLPASLNMDYIDVLSDAFDPSLEWAPGMDELIKQSRVRKELEAIGYSIVSFETGFEFSQIDDADYYLQSPEVAQVFGLEGLTGFEAMLMQSSAARILTDGVVASSVLERVFPDIDYPRIAHRLRTLFVIDQLESGVVQPLQGPKFVFAHIVAPHDPFVFEQDGSFVKVEIDSNNREAYLNQLIYINSRLLPMLEAVIENSNPEPIVIVQADHGLRSFPNERLAILSAYYLPGDGSSYLYPSITPVNSFRLIFDLYFGADFGLIADRSLYSEYGLPFALDEIPDTRPGCEAD